MSTTTPSKPKSIRILMLHGYTQSGPLFRAKTRALEKSLAKHFALTHSIELIYPTAPLRIAPSDIPGFSGQEIKNDEGRGTEEAYGWWRRKDHPHDASSSSSATANGYAYTYEGIYDGLARIAETLEKEGPFDGVVGFSQGGALAGMVAGLLEPGRKEAFVQRQDRGGMEWPSSFDAKHDENTRDAEAQRVHPPLSFAVSYSGFVPSPLPPLYAAFYEPKIATPMLHFLGTLDTVVSEERSLALVKACEKSGEETIVRHPGGHFLPSSQKACVNALVTFIRETCRLDEYANESGTTRTRKEAARSDEKDRRGVRGFTGFVLEFTFSFGPEPGSDDSKRHAFLMLGCHLPYLTNCVAMCLLDSHVVRFYEQLKLDLYCQKDLHVSDSKQQELLAPFRRDLFSFCVFNMHGHWNDKLANAALADIGREEPIPLQGVLSVVERFKQIADQHYIYRRFGLAAKYWTVAFERTKFFRVRPYLQQLRTPACNKEAKRIVELYYVLMANCGAALYQLANGSRKHSSFYNKAVAAALKCDDHAMSRLSMDQDGKLAGLWVPDSKQMDGEEGHEGEGW